MKRNVIVQKSIKKNAVLNVCKTLTTTLFPIITYMHVSRIFGSEGYGKISFSNSIVQYFILIAMLGITNYATSEAAKVRDQKEKLNPLVSEIMLINIISMAAAYGLLIILMKISSQLSAYQYFIMVYSMNILLRVIGMEWLYSAMEDYFYITVRTIFVQAVLLICVFVFIHTKEDLIRYSFIQVAAAGGSNIFNLIHSRKYVAPVRIRIASVKKHMKPILTIFLMTLFVNLFTHIDSTMVGLMQGDSAVGLYAAGDKMSSMVAGVIGAVSMVMLPRVAYYFQNGQKPELENVIVKVVNVVMLIAIPSTLGICLLSEPIILIFSGAAFAPAIMTVRILAFRVLLSPLNAIFVLYVFIPLKKEKISVFVTAMAAAANFAVNLFLIPVLSYNGAAIATVAAELVELFFVILTAGRFLPVKKFFNRIWQYVVAGTSIPLVWMIVNHITRHYILNTALTMLGSAAAYFTILFILKNDYIVYVMRYLQDKVRAHKK